MISPGVRIVASGGNITIADNVFIGRNCTLIAFADLNIGERTLIGQNCSLHTENHGGPGHRLTFTSKPINLGADVWLGAGVVVTAGSDIGVGVTVGANSVVTKCLPIRGIYGGIPARHIRSDG